MRWFHAIDMFAYFHSMVTQKSGLLSTTSVPAQRLEPDRNMSDTHTSTEVASTSAANGNGDGDAMEEQMQTLMSMFPDYSIEFLKCCLKVCGCNHFQGFYQSDSIKTFSLSVIFKT